MPPFPTMPNVNLPLDFLNTKFENEDFMTDTDKTQQDVIFDFTADTDQEVECPKVPGANLTPQDVLCDAKKVIAGPRREAYGNARTSFTRIARLWSGYLGREVLAKDVALMMVLFKVAREQNAHSHDNLVDMAGYAALTADCVN